MSEGQQKVVNVQQKQAKQTGLVISEPQKKLNSYTYWVDQKNKSRQLPLEQRPQKIDPPKVDSKKNEDGRSNWNTAGTWEPRAIPLTQIQKQYTYKLNQWLDQNCPQAKIKKLQLKGQCQVLFIRTKKALTYEIKGQVEFQKKPLELKQDQTNETYPGNNQQTQIPASDKGSSQALEKSQEVSKDKQTMLKSQPKKTKAHTMTFEIVDLTDHGDRQYKSKADDAEDKKFISKESQTLLVLLEEVLKSYK